MCPLSVSLWQFFSAINYTRNSWSEIFGTFSFNMQLANLKWPPLPWSRKFVMPRPHSRTMGNFRCPLQYLWLSQRAVFILTLRPWEALENSTYFSPSRGSPSTFKGGIRVLYIIFYPTLRILLPCLFSPWDLLFSPLLLLWFDKCKT